ncbi:DUF397 domain-containing protein [Streptomyces sp. NPDC014983]|uniref:DUF397 domain-containing protein n=1 Tax=Streptomyces sp. NPDC014983 TaxID=3364933 RepID=UPI0036FC3785
MLDVPRAGRRKPPPRGGTVLRDRLGLGGWRPLNSALAPAVTGVLLGAGVVARQSGAWPFSGPSCHPSQQLQQRRARRLRRDRPTPTPIHVRDPKDTDGPRLTVTPTTWTTLVVYARREPAISTRLGPDAHGFRYSAAVVPATDRAAVTSC